MKTINKYTTEYTQNNLLGNLLWALQLLPHLVLTTSSGG